MKSTIIPLSNLPPGLSGHLKVTKIPADRDWRDAAVSGAAIVGTLVLVTPYAILLDPLGIVAGLGVLFYVVKVASDAQIFTPKDQFAMDAVLEFEHEASLPQECERRDPRQDVRHLQ